VANNLCVTFKNTLCCSAVVFCACDKRPISLIGTTWSSATVVASAVQVSCTVWSSKRTALLERPQYLPAVGAGVAQQALRGKALHTHHHVFHPFQNVHSDWSYEFTPNTVNTYDRGATLPGRWEVSLAATTPYLSIHAVYAMTKQISSLFWDVTQRWLLVDYQSAEGRSHLNRG